MKKTAFTEYHQSLGAKMVEFAGFYMPVQYEGINIEHDTVRKNVGVFDVSHMGEIWVKGPKALDLVQWITSNDASKLYDGKIQYSCFPNDRGGIVDDLLVYRIDSETYLLVVNASNIEKDWEWINKNNIFGATLYNASDEISQLAVQGPNAIKVLQKLTEEDLSKIEYYSFKKIDFAGVKQVIMSATGYTGAGGFEIYFANKDAKQIWNAIFEAGKEFNIKPIGLGARDTLRLEMGYCLYGNDIDDTTSPLEAGLGWITKFTKKFINSDNLLKQKEQGVSRRLVGFELVDKGIPRHHYKIYNSDKQEIGFVTSGTMSPSLKKPIGMGYVKTEYSNENSEIFIKIREDYAKAKVVKLPFIKNK